MCKTDSSNLVATGCFIQQGILCLFDLGDVHLKRKLFYIERNLERQRLYCHELQQTLSLKRFSGIN